MVELLLQEVVAVLGYSYPVQWIFIPGFLVILSDFAMIWILVILCTKIISLLNTS